MRIRTIILLSVFLLSLKDLANAQRVRELRGSANTAGFNDIFPSISGDGNTLVFMNDYSDDNSYITMVSKKETGGKWGKPQEMTILNPSRLNAPGGYCLSFDGNTLLYSTRKGEGVGGYDLWYMDYTDGKWSTPRNIGRPVNSPLNDTAPAFSPDGSKLYFTRCTTIDASGGKECKIFVSERKRGRIKGWEDPVELDSKINTGNTLFPRLLSDNKTLVFSSSKPGGKGGQDWYLSQKDENEGWSDPVNLDFINTSEDDLYFSMYYRPDRLLSVRLNSRDKLDIVEIDIPEKYQPDKVVIKIGTVFNSGGDPVDSEIRARDYENGESVTFTFPDEETGEYTIIIPEGKVYDFSIVPKRSDELYYSEILDYQVLRSSRKESSDYTLQMPSSNAVLALNAIQFIPEKEVLDPKSDEELVRLARLMRRNEGYTFEIAAYQDSIITDSIPRPGLTELITDTTRWEEFVYEYEYQYRYLIDEDSATMRFPEFSSMQLDSMFTIWNDSLSQVKNDTLLAEMFLASLVGVDTIENIVDTIQHVEIKYTYHNDLTSKRAGQLAAELMARDIDPGRMIPVGYGDWKQPISAIKEELFEDGFVEIIFKR